MIWSKNMSDYWGGGGRGTASMSDTREVFDGAFNEAYSGNPINMTKLVPYKLTE